MSAPNLFRTCRSVSSECPVEGTIYGYYPSLVGNAFLLAWFSIFLVSNTYLGIYYKTWTYMIALVLGCICELLGYAGRIILNSNPYSKPGFNIQIVCLIIAPAFFSAGIYLTLKHLTLCFGPHYSLLTPKYYTWIFITCDILSLVIQGAGGGVSATASTPSTQKTGNDLALAGIVFQVFTLLCFGTLAVLYYLRRRRSDPIPSKEAEIIQEKTGFKLFIASLSIAYLCIITRCCYRIAEMARGWRNPIMTNEVDFMVLDGAMIGLAVLCLSTFHPGFCFPRLGKGSDNVPPEYQGKA